MRKYFIYLDDGKDVYKVAIPAKDEETACEYVKGNGEIIAVKDVTNDLKYSISLDNISTALESAQFPVYAIDFIIRALSEIGIAD